MLTTNLQKHPEHPEHDKQEPRTPDRPQTDTKMTQSLMLSEILQAPQVLDRLHGEASHAVRALARQIVTDDARTCVTVARGSSDHAAHHFSALMARMTGRFVASMPPSWTTVLESPWPAQRWRPIAFSQSGRSPDLLVVLQALDPGGRHSAAFVNDAGSPLAQAVMHPIDLQAHPERAVAATKSVLAQLLAGAMLVEACADGGKGHPALAAELQALSAGVDQVLGAAPWDLGPGWAQARHLLVVGRGQSLAIAHEIALKCKEVCQLHAEAISAAELRHGPQALADAGLHVLVLAPDDLGAQALHDTATHMTQLGAVVAAAGPHPWCDLPVPALGLQFLAGLPLLAVAYRWVEALSRARGLDPDRPRHLTKVTLTL
jgi:glucosamine--fructose-6-phosphate aminotransferase (isomerizing)